MNSQNLVDSDTILQATGIVTEIEAFSGVGDVQATHAERVLSYIRKDLIESLNMNSHIAGVFCTKELAGDLPENIDKIVCDDPTWAYFSLVDYLAANQIFESSIIAPGCITEGSWIAKNGVEIAPHVRLDPFVSVYEATKIGANSVVRSGAVLGLDCFQHQRTSKGIISPRHDGKLDIGENVEIGAGCAISRGFSYRNTIIEDEVKIDGHVSIAHGVRIKKGSILCAGVLILGHSTIGENVFIGPGAVIRNRVNIGDGARISIGSVVTQDVPAGETVTGNFAVPHEDWLAFVKKLSSV